VNNNTLYILSLILMFQDKGFFLMNVRLRMYKYCYSNEGVIYAKDLFLIPKSAIETVNLTN